MNALDGCAVIIQARNTSKRLPGKATLPLWATDSWTKTPVQIISARCRDWPIIWALPDEPASDDIVKTLKSRSSDTIYLGSVNDLADRRWQAARLTDATYFALIGADDFLIAPEALRLAFECAVYTGTDYVQTIGWPLGCNVQVVSRQLLDDAANLDRKYKKELRDDEREHLTLYWDRRSNYYPPTILHRKPDDNDLRITLDTPEDYRLMSHLVARFGPNVTTETMVSFLRENPLWQVDLPHYVPTGTPVRTAHQRILVGNDPSKGDL